MSSEVEHGSSELEYSLDIYGLSKRFKRRTLGRRNGYSTIKSNILNLFSGATGQEARFTTAVENLTIRVPRGSSLGIIGRNGSGKSSLLKLITGIYKPDRGRVSVNGRIAALIELGAGFHPDFTGRENLYLAGAMHGLSRREVTQLLNQIIDFSELSEVIDDPVRTYSSGMFMRLGFSLAVHINPDILLVDEVLAVGDAGFVAKCKDRISFLRSQGKTLLLVSHDLDAVERWCDEVVWLDNGVVKDRGEPRRVIDSYRTFLEKGQEQELATNLEKTHAQSSVTTATGSVDSDQLNRNVLSEQRWGSREIELTKIELTGSADKQQLLFHPDDALSIIITYRVNEVFKDPVFGIAIHRSDGVLVHGSNTDIERIPVPQLGRQGTISYVIDHLQLVEGAYSVDVAVHTADGYPYDYRKNAIQFLVRSPVQLVGVFAPQHSWSFS